MSEVLELPHLPEEHGVTKVEVRSGGVESHLDDERKPLLTASLKSPSQFLPTDHINAALRQSHQLLFDVHRRSTFTLWLEREPS